MRAPSNTRHHAEWLSLIEVSGPFLSLPVLLRVFRQGLDADDTDHARDLRLAFEEWQDNQLGARSRAEVHRAWIDFVLQQTLELPDQVVATGQDIPQSLKATVSEHGETLRPDIAIRNPDGVPNAGKPRLLIQTYPLAQSLDKPVAEKRWKASPDTRMMELLHATDVRLGLVTNGERWMLVDAPRGETTGYASWYASLWLEERLTLRAFRSLLGTHRFFAVADDETLEAMLAESALNQQEVTDQLGYQVRRAVEVLVQTIDRADQDRGRQLLEDVPETVLYEAALTVMMRLVFLFCAEERELLLLGDPLYDEHYAVSTLADQLQVVADQHGEEVLERRRDAWCRLLSTFRAVYGGVRHERMSLLAYAGSLFDPDRFPFLEGRQPHTSWRTHPANPLPVDNRTVLHLLRSLQFLEMQLPGGGPAESRRLSFRALDIEQIGHVYEGLLDHTAKRATEPILGLQGTKDKEPEVSLPELERLKEQGEEKLVAYVREQTGRSESALRKALQPTVEGDAAGRLLTVCGSDDVLCERVRPFAGLLRDDGFGYPVVIGEGSVYVTAGTDRRSSGTHYTPRSLTEPIVQYTLEPLVYVGPAEGKPKEEWQLKPPAELFDLRICDMACGSGAFLVQACRYMSERLLEAWEDAERRVASGEWRETAEEEGDGGDGGSELSGSGGVAEGDGLGGSLLRSNQGLPEGGAVRLDQPDSAGGVLDPGQHSRGTGPSAHEGVPQPPEHGPRLLDGTGDPSAAQPTSQSAGRADATAPAEAVRRGEPDAVWPSQLAVEASVGRPLTTRHPPLITPFGLPATGHASESVIPSDPDERLAFARRLVAQRCLYGVDKNPLAVEMAKLSLWLLTLAKDKPFTFLDHAIRCGDSLVGIRDLRQLEVFNLDGQGESNPLFLQFLRGRIERAVELRRRIEERPADRSEDVDAQAELMRQAEEQIGRLKWAADMLVAADFQGTTAREREAALLDNSMVVAQHFDETDTDFLRRKAEAALGGRRTLHWPLEFPEVVVERGGFDAFVCNPPFLPGPQISRRFGGGYRDWVKRLAPHAHGNSDLVCCFLLRAYRLVSESGCYGMLATKSIAEGDSRLASLRWLLTNGARIFYAHQALKWPGSASVTVAVVCITRRDWEGLLTLNGRPAKAINDFLADQALERRPPEKLAANTGTAFRGSILAGEGFLLDLAQAERLAELDPPCRQVLFPTIGGEALNAHPLGVADLFAINVCELSAVECEQRFPAVWRHLSATVKVERETAETTASSRPFWQYWSDRPKLRAWLRTHERVLAISQATKHIAFAFLPATWVHLNTLNLLTTEQDSAFGLLQSSLHIAWALEYAASLESGTIRYTYTTCFETFPFPAEPGGRQPLTGVAQQYIAIREGIGRDRQCGLTGIYNGLCDPTDMAEDIGRLRELHVEMDHAVAAAYGWTDLELGHGFHETKQGLRYTISDPARREVLSRLLQLNHDRYAEEVAQGLHEKGKPKGKSTKRARKKEPSGSSDGRLFQ